MKVTWKDTFQPLLAGGVIGLMFLSLIKDVVELELEENQNKIETTTAKPIYQQRIGDGAEPDLLIIYEAEVDGVKVYPSVIKEAK